MHKLGRVYASDEDDSVKCLEGHSGFIAATKECHGKAAGKCKSDAQCQEENGGSKYYYCSKVSKTCQRQECYLPETTLASCAKKYSHMYSCVDNENKDGGHHCEVTCTWETATADMNKAVLTKALSRMKADIQLWQTPSKAVEILSALAFDKNNAQGNELDWDELVPIDVEKSFFRTCKFGQAAECVNVTPQQLTDVRQLTSEPPCMTCSLLTGGTYGYTDGTGDAETEYGTHPFSARGQIYHLDAYQANSSTQTSLSQISFPYTCGKQDTSLKSKPLAAIIPFSTSGVNIDAVKNNFKKVSEYQANVFSSLNKEIEALYAASADLEFYSLGKSPACALHYQTYPRATTQGTNAVYLIYIPQQQAQSAFRRRREGQTGLAVTTTYIWPFTETARAACCTDTYYKKFPAMNCVDLAADPDVKDME